MPGEIGSVNGFSNWEGPRTVQDFFARFIHPHGVVPTLANRQAVDASILATTKIDVDGSVVVGFGRYVIVAVGAEIVHGDKTIRIVDGDRPEGVYGNVYDRERIGSTVVFLDASKVIDGVLLRQAAPPGGSPYQVLQRVGFVACPKGA